MIFSTRDALLDNNASGEEDINKTTGDEGSNTMMLWCVIRGALISFTTDLGRYR